MPLCLRPCSLVSFCIFNLITCFMKKIFFLPYFIFLLLQLTAQNVKTPDQVYGSLFTDVQMSKIFPDGKTFVDCVPKTNPKDIVKDYLTIKNNPAIKFSLKLFV